LAWVWVYLRCATLVRHACLRKSQECAAPDLRIEPGRADESKECKGWDPRPTACATAARGRRAHACIAREAALLHMTVPPVQPLHQD